jgi:hypothetical protein
MRGREGTMTTDPFFALAVTGLLLLGAILAFGGYRFFLIPLPVIGFLFGFGAQAVQAVFGCGFLATVASWAVGLLFAVVFVAFSYLFYLFAVALVAGESGYALGVGVLLAVGLDFGLLVWVVRIVA